MSWGSCASGSNNIHSDFPPIMSDGRNYASWQPGAVINQKIREENGIKSNFEYRSFMTKNADDIIAANQMEACNQCCSCPARPSQSKLLLLLSFINHALMTLNLLVMKTVILRRDTCPLINLTVEY